MVKYSIVIPVYNREKNLGCVLLSLLKQEDIDFSKYEVIVIDEGTFPAIKTVQRFAEGLNISYLWRVGTTGSPGMAKNWAVKNSKANNLIFFDSDVVFNDKCLYWYDVLAKKYPGVIICGRYDWLKPMDVNEEVVGYQFDRLISMELPQTKPATGPIPGVDPRWQSEGVPGWTKPARLSKSSKPFSLAMFGSNVLIPKQLFEKVNGFDPNIIGHGGEDNMLGWELFNIGAKAMFTDDTIGWHIYHDRNQQQNEIDVKKNIKYIEKKYRDLHIKYGIIADPNVNMVYCDDGTFVPIEKKRELHI